MVDTESVSCLKYEKGNLVIIIKIATFYFEPAIPLLGVFAAMSAYIEDSVWTWLFMEALFVIAKDWKSKSIYKNEHDICRH